MDREGIPDLWTSVKDCKFFQTCSAMMCAIVIGCSGTIAMSLIIRKNKLKNNGDNRLLSWITVHKFSYSKRLDLIDVHNFLFGE